MTVSELIDKINTYKAGTTEKSWKMEGEGAFFENDYISLIRIDSSNSWVTVYEMQKQWSIIFEKKNEFDYSEKLLLLKKHVNIDITPVRRGKNKGAYGIRLYEMKQDPDEEVVIDILNFIFGE